MELKKHIYSHVLNVVPERLDKILARATIVASVDPEFAVCLGATRNTMLTSERAAMSELCFAHHSGQPENLPGSRILTFVMLVHAAAARQI